VSLTGLASLLVEARAGRYAIVAFNVITLEYGEAIVAAAEEVGSPVILQLSQNAIRYHGDRLQPLGLACLELARAASVPVAVHLDHATTLDLCERAAALGFGSVMFDASALPDEANVAQTTGVVHWAHEAGLAVEAEIGIVGGKDGRHEVMAATTPAEAHRFAELTGVDALAVQVGSSHAMVGQTSVLDLPLIGRLRASVPVPLVLHGSTGVSDEQLAAAARVGIAKINIGTRLNVAFTAAVRAALAADERVVDPRPYLAIGRAAVSRSAATLIRTVGPARS
jgi:fructose-bisphosphate aldolase class II